MAIAFSILAVLAVISAIGSASSAQRKRSARLNTAPAQEKPSSLATAPSPSTHPQPATNGQSQSAQPAPSPTHQQSTQPTSSPAQQQSAPSIDPVAQELAESIVEMMPEIPLATTLMVSEVVNPQENELGAVQLDRPNSAVQNASPRTEAHRGHTLLEEIAGLEAGHGDRIAYLAQYVEHPDSVMRVSVAFALGDLATRSQGPEQEEIIAVLLRLSQDVDPQVRVQAAAALGAIGHPSIPALE